MSTNASPIQNRTPGRLRRALATTVATAALLGLAATAAPAAAADDDTSALGVTLPGVAVEVTVDLPGLPIEVPGDAPDDVPGGLETPDGACGWD